MGNVCNQCGDEFKVIGSHWSSTSDCTHPSFDDRQREIIVGLMMGDGSIQTNDYGNPLLQANMVSENYLKFIDDEFGIFGNGVSLKHTAEESAKVARDSGFSPNADEKNYSDMYYWSSMRHPELYEFYSWYSSGEKVWPENINLTPTTLKHWYCGDGSLSTHGSHKNIRISMTNELDNKDKIDSMFKRSSIPKPSNYIRNERDDGRVDYSITFTKEQSDKLLEYMGEPLPDFEYKWDESFK